MYYRLSIHASYFLSLQQDLLTASRYVEMTPDNFGTYSTEFTRLLLAACSEVDVVAKLLCKKWNAASRADNIDGYQKEILANSPDFHHAELWVPRFDLRLRPWESWATGKNPNWWGDHQDVKHNRDQHFKAANLGNALSATAGLFCLLMASEGNAPHDLFQWAGIYPPRKSEK